MNIKASLSLEPLRNNRPFFLRSEMDRLLSLSMLFGLLLVAVRMIHTGRLTFIFLPWNLFLAYLPYLITEYLSRRQHRQQISAELEGRSREVFSPQEIRVEQRRKLRGQLFFGALSLAWLLCIPNSFYILTDLFHLGDWYNDRLMPQWYDLAMILSFAWNGLLLGVLSVRQMEKIFRPLLPAHKEIFFLYPVMWLNALGIYIGRFLRFNSWDIVADPFQLCRDIFRLLVHPLQSQYAWGMIFCYSILMTLIYLMLKKISKAIT